MKAQTTLRSAFLLLLPLAACTPVPEATADPGTPLPGLTAAALHDFNEGRALFHRAFTPDDGIGPIFNQNRCSSCHDLPTIGGHGTEAVRKATRFEHGKCELLEDSGGDMIQMQVTPALRAAGIEIEPMPRKANGTTRILPTSLYGLGLIEAIDSAAIVAHADPDDRNRDGISGGVGLTADGRLGRFGRKANFADVRAFVEDALAHEMGLTTAAHPHEQKPGGRPLPEGVDPASDPEIDEDAIVLLTNYVRMLAPPRRADLPRGNDGIVSQREDVSVNGSGSGSVPQRKDGSVNVSGSGSVTNPESAAVRSDAALRGGRTFMRIGCAECHTPSFTMETDALASIGGNSKSDHAGGLSGKRRVQLYSDLLLHDLGDEMATVCSRNASPSEWRTTPLMGLRFRHELMHDGRAQSLQSAIEAHGGEASRSRDQFRRLQPDEQLNLIRFLKSL